MKAILVVAVLFCAAAAKAQSITPIFAEGKIKKTVGTFTVKNLSVQNIPVILEPKELVGATPEGREVFAPLSSNVHLTLQETSAILPPRGSREFEYRLTCDHAPCAVTFWTAFQVGKTREGITVQTVMMHTVYACEKAKDCRKETRATLGLK